MRKFALLTDLINAETKKGYTVDDVAAGFIKVASEFEMVAGD